MQVLSELIMHPLQRPLSLVPGLHPSPWWPIFTQSSTAASTDDPPRLLPWLEPFLRPSNLAAMQVIHNART